jgi:hypothetical protein
MLSAAGGLFWLSGLAVGGTYAGSVLLPLITTGFGLGLGIGPSISVATLGVRAEDSGVASAMVRCRQQSDRADSADGQPPLHRGGWPQGVLAPA